MHTPQHEHRRLDLDLHMDLYSDGRQRLNLQNRHRLITACARLLVALLVVVLSTTTTPPLASASNKGSSSGSGSSGSSGGSGSTPGKSGPSSSKVENDDGSIPAQTNEVSTVAPATAVVATIQNPVVISPPVTPAPNTPGPTSSPERTVPPSTRQGGSGTPGNSQTKTPSTPTSLRSAGGESRIVRSVRCGSTTLQVEIRVKENELRVRTSVSPRTKAVWTATVLQDRKITWRGSARRGEIDRKLKNLSGSEMITIRLTSSTGAICAAEISVPA